ncbi:putative PAN domain protein, partial [Trichinella spiralis]|uniref:putative PAN domain protein n=1 Tax=Trichinella spiralis TaxID=6334 RepID=UPI0001EFD264
PTGQCGARKEPEKEAAALCKEGELPKIIEVSGYTDPDAKEAISLSGYTLKDCATACLDNKDAEGRPLEIKGGCASLIYEGTTCKLDDTKIEYIRNLQPSADSTYMMVQCFPEKLVSQCPNNFIYAPGHVLVGFAKTVITTSSESECVEKCLTSTEDLGFYCKSGMFYQEDRNENCILNTESRSTQPNVYTEDEAAVMYFELSCGRSGRRLSKKFYKNFSQALFDLPAAGLWTQWSPCATTDGSSIRYRACREKDIRNCPKEVKAVRTPK